MRNWETPLYSTGFVLYKSGCFLDWTKYLLKKFPINALDTGMRCKKKKNREKNVALWEIQHLAIFFFFFWNIKEWFIKFLKNKRGHSELSVRRVEGIDLYDHFGGTRPTREYWGGEKRLRQTEEGLHRKATSADESTNRFARRSPSNLMGCQIWTWKVKHHITYITTNSNIHASLYS